MTTKLDKNTPNNDRGIYIAKSRRVVIDTPFGEIASWIKAGTAGDIVWRNQSGELNIYTLEAGEPCNCSATEIVSAGTVEGTPETTTATNLLWASTPLDLEG